jgi:F-type H+-transporting ATPase subunit epsilon
MSFQCTIVTPEEQALDETVQQAIVPAHDGLIGILTGRSPLLAQLGIGPLRVDLANGQQRYFLVEGGVAQMKDNRLTVLTTSAKKASELDADTARAEYAEAVARRATGAKEMAARQKQMDRARAAMALAGKK